MGDMDGKSMATSSASNAPDELPRRDAERPVWDALFPGRGRPAPDLTPGP